MTELIFHIGMNKCASTTLQDTVFKFVPGYLGKFNHPGKVSRDLAQQFEDNAPVGGRQTGDINGVSNWLKKVRSEMSEKDPELNKFLVSSESLCQSNKINLRPIIPFLSSINREAIKDGTVKVIIVFRNQADILASNYAQNSDVTYESSQINFEYSATNLIGGKQKAYLNWGEWAQELIGEFGKENVCILLLEEINTVDFWEKLIRFIDTEKLSAKDLHEKSFSSKKNKRRIGDKVWKLTPFSISEKARIDTLKIFTFLWKPNKMPARREKAMKKSIEMRKKYLELRGFKNGKLVDTSVTLSSDLRERIQDNFEKSNRVLSEILGKDLKKLGY